MNKEYTSLGLMSGTSGDGVDASIIKSDGLSKYEVILNKYYEYDQEIYQNIHLLKEKINSSKDLKNYSHDLKNLERIITIFHVKDSIMQNVVGIYLWKCISKIFWGKKQSILG